MHKPPCIVKHASAFNRRKALLFTGITSLLLFAGSAYAYVFIAGAPQLDPPQPDKATGLQFEVASFSSQAMGTTRKYGVVLPPGYAEHPKTQYPVIFLLHGGHGDERDFEDKAALTSVLHQLYLSDRLPPSLVITPDGNDRRGSSPFWDSNYYDGPNGKVGTLIGQDMVQMIRSRYRVRPEPSLWAMGGLSSGGWGALNLGVLYHRQFHTLFSHSGYFIDHSGPRNSPQVTIKALSPAERQPLRIYLDAGKSDEKYLTATQDFAQVLQTLGVSHEFHVFPGGHGIIGANVGWNYWHKHLTDSLRYVGVQFKTALHQTATPKSPPKHLQASQRALHAILPQIDASTSDSTSHPTAVPQLNS